MLLKFITDFVSKKTKRISKIEKYSIVMTLGIILLVLSLFSKSPILFFTSALLLYIGTPILIEEEGNPHENRYNNLGIRLLFLSRLIVMPLCIAGIIISIYNTTNDTIDIDFAVNELNKKMNRKWKIINPR
jgi:cell division protein FtsL